MNPRVARVLGPDAREYTRNQTIAALTLAGVHDPHAVATDQTLVMSTVHIAPSPLLMARRWKPVSYNPAEDQTAWGVGTQL